jgi:hypothetical protein
MPIRARCADCAAEYNLADTLAGKKIRCKKCQAVIAVPAAADEPVTTRKAVAPAARSRPAASPKAEEKPRPKRPRDEDDEDEAPRSRKRDARPAEGKGLSRVWIFGGAGALLLIAGVVVAIVLMRDKGGPKGSDGGSADGGPRDGAPKDGGPRDKGGLVTPGGAAPYQMPANAGGSIDVGKSPVVVYPAIPSPFFAASQVPAPNLSLLVYDARTMQSVGAPLQLGPGGPLFALSPDGKQLAAVAASGDTVQVWSVATGEQKPYKLLEGASKVGTNGMLAFLSEGELIVNQYRQPDGSFLIIDLKSGGARTFPHNARGAAPDWALSPNGRYLAYWAGGELHRVRVVELATGKQVADLAYPMSHNAWIMDALDFSPDGALLSALLIDGTNNARRVVTWGLDTGAVRSEHRSPISAPALSRGNKLQWLPDQRGWMVMERGLMSAGDGKLIASLPAPPASPPVRRRVLNGGYYLREKSGAGQSWQLILEALPKQ